MLRGFSCLVLAVGVAVLPGAALALGESSDPDVERGVRLAEDGDYDGAILTLDAAARRLAPEPASVRELSRAYLYLGIAYLGKGHEAAAKAQFRAALARASDLTLSPEKYPPKVIDLFEAAREEARRTSSAPPQPGPDAAAPAKRKGHGKLILIGAGAVAVAGGVGLALGTGGGDTGVSAAVPPGDTRQVQTFTGTLCGDFTLCEQNRQYSIAVTGSGTLEATATWTETRASFTLELHDSSDQPVAAGNRITTTSSQLTATVVAQGYKLFLDRQDELPDPAEFVLTVRHP